MSFSFDYSSFAVVPVEDFADDVLVGFLVTAAQDVALCDATYLPANMTPEEARRWAAGKRGVAWVLVVDGSPVGWWEFGPVKSSCGFSLPEATFEREVWLLEEFRGRRLVREATRRLRETLLASGVRHLLGVTWESNTNAVKAMSRSGFRRLGRGWWEWGTEYPGWCEVWLGSLPELGSPAG